MFRYAQPNYQLYLSPPASVPSHCPSTTRYDFLIRCCCPTNPRYHTSVPQAMHRIYSSLDQPTKPHSPRILLATNRPIPSTTTSPYALQSISRATSIQSRTRKTTAVNVSGICEPKNLAFSGPFSRSLSVQVSILLSYHTLVQSRHPSIQTYPRIP